MFSKNKRDLDNGVVAPNAKPAVPSIISTDMKVVGDIISDGEVQVDGAVEGDIKSKVLLVGEPANIKGEIIVDNIEVFGTINGQIKAESVTLAKTAHVVGDILHENLAIEKGAFLEGHCKRMPERKDAGISLVRQNGNDPLPPDKVKSGENGDKQVKTP
jgi:cytoskeletal protein CcmA (bactofilin family)